MLNIAIIGLGSMGKNHYRILKDISDVNICALCDVVQNDPYDEKFFLDIDEMLTSAKPDAVIIAVPTFLHKEVALKCIDKNVNIFIEKPAASTIVDAKIILDAVNAKNLKSCVGHVERFNPVVQALKNELTSQEIYSVAITRVGPFPPRIADVGVLTDLSVHDIDLIRFITGRNILKSTIYKSRKIHNHHEDNAVLCFELENEVIADITTNWLTPFKKRQIEVACKDGYFQADLMGQTLNEYSGFSVNNSFVTRGCHIKKDEPLIKELEAFVAYIKSGERGSLASIEDSIITLEIATSNDS
ncbi:MAG: gfo/Idh/MocA family oxidoreductase [Helicobacteraceae bacterium]|nr:gfo/Idh/MocA family oxidoreductase [Helicobacteraceae bacterium]